MKHMRIFKDTAEYQAFTGGGEYITPNVCMISGSKDVYCKPKIKVIIPNIITFTVDGVEYQAIEGMTWEEWVNSDYNIDGYIIIEDQTFSGIHKHISLNDGKVAFENPNNGMHVAVEYTDIINSNYIYITETRLEPH